MRLFQSLTTESRQVRRAHSFPVHPNSAIYLSFEDRAESIVCPLYLFRVIPVSSFSHLLSSSFYLHHPTFSPFSTAAAKKSGHQKKGILPCSMFASLQMAFSYWCLLPLPPPFSASGLPELWVEAHWTFIFPSILLALTPLCLTAHHSRSPPGIRNGRWQLSTGDTFTGECISPKLERIPLATPSWTANIHPWGLCNVAKSFHTGWSSNPSSAI